MNLLTGACVGVLTASTPSWALDRGTLRDLIMGPDPLFEELVTIGFCLGAAVFGAVAYRLISARRSRRGK